MIEDVRLALGITSLAYDGELEALIRAALLDLKLAAVSVDDPEDPLILQAVKTYVRAHFGSPADYDRLKASYDEQKAQLMMAKNYAEF